MNRYAMRSAVAAGALAVLAGCSKPAEKGPQKAPLTPVEIAVVERRSVPLEIPSVGTVEPVATVAVKPKVGGEVQKAFFDEGASVKEGQQLFLIDPRPYDAVLKRAEANTETARVQARNAVDQVNRYTSLMNRGAASEEQFAQLKAAADSQQATVKAREADVEEAALSKEWTSVVAPISGRSGAILVKPGNIVQPNGETMTVINQIQPAYVAFAVPENALGDIRAQMRRKELSVTAVDAKKNETLETGTLTFIDNTVDKTSGMVMLKATFANEKEALWPGQFVDVNLKLDETLNALVIPTSAILEGLKGCQVFVIEGDTAVLKRVEIERTFGSLSVIRSGLEAGEKVITSGQLRVAPGGKVQIKKEISAGELAAQKPAAASQD